MQGADRKSASSAKGSRRLSGGSAGERLQSSCSRSPKTWKPENTFSPYVPMKYHVVSTLSQYIHDTDTSRAPNVKVSTNLLILSSFVGCLPVVPGQLAVVPPDGG